MKRIEISGPGMAHCLDNAMFIEYDKGKEHPTKQGWVLLGAYSVPEIHIVAGLLEANGIEHFIEGEAMGDALGLTVGPMGEKLLFVKAGDYDDAIRLVEGDEGDNS